MNYALLNIVLIWLALGMMAFTAWWVLKPTDKDGDK